MICLRCDNQEFVAKLDAVIQQEFKGELLDVHTPASACSKCGWLTVDLDQADELRRRTADAYRKKHGLLTSDAIKAIRKVLGLNQREFATFLGVGEASVKRWETWLVQEKGNDELMRLKFDELIRKHVPQETTPNVWVTCNYDELIVPGNGFTIQPPASTEPVKPSRWARRVHSAEPEYESQLSLCGMKIPDICGLSPPSRSGEAAFSLSTPSPEPISRGALKKKMLTIQNQHEKRMRMQCTMTIQSLGEP